MVINFLTVWIMFGLLFSGSSAQPAVVVKRWEPIEYPPMSRLARVQGTVSITANLEVKGNSSDYQAVTGKAEGQPMLAEAAVANLKKWTFSCDECRLSEDRAFHVIYEFRFDKECMEPKCFKSSSTFREGRVLVEFSSPEVIEVTSRSE